jgi:hypothetical protein
MYFPFSLAEAKVLEKRGVIPEDILLPHNEEKSASF